MNGKPIATAPRDGSIIIVRGGIAHWYKDAWYTLTGESYPGRPIQWVVDEWWEMPTGKEDNTTKIRDAVRRLRIDEYDGDKDERWDYCARMDDELTLVEAFLDKYPEMES